MDGSDSAPATLRAYIESNLRFMYEHRAYVTAIIEVVSNLRTETGELFYQNEDESIYEPLVEILSGDRKQKGVSGSFPRTLWPEPSEASSILLGPKSQIKIYQIRKT